jgi:hypothetical protein
MVWRLVTMSPKHPIRSGFDFFQFVYPHPAECCIRVVILFGGWMIHGLGPCPALRQSMLTDDETRYISALSIFLP